MCSSKKISSAHRKYLNEHWAGLAGRGSSWRAQRPRWVRCLWRHSKQQHPAHFPFSSASEADWRDNAHCPLGLQRAQWPNIRSNSVPAPEKWSADRLKRGPAGDVAFASGPDLIPCKILPTCRHGRTALLVCRSNRLHCCIAIAETFTIPLPIADGRGYSPTCQPYAVRTQRRRLVVTPAISTKSTPTCTTRSTWPSLKMQSL